MFLKPLYKHTLIAGTGQGVLIARAAALLRGFGGNPLRKPGILAPPKELLVPYQPSDYRAIVAGDWEASEGRATVVSGARQT